VSFKINQESPPPSTSPRGPNPRACRSCRSSDLRQGHAMVHVIRWAIAPQQPLPAKSMTGPLNSCHRSDPNASDHGRREAAAVLAIGPRVSCRMAGDIGKHRTSAQVKACVRAV
jgi:hypothetical protein